MSQAKELDIAHVMFLEMIETFISNLGASAAKGTLMRTAIKTAERLPETSYASMDEYVAGLEDLSNPIAQIEGKAVHLGDGVFGLPNCPFARSIANYRTLHGELPASYLQVTEDFNRPGKMAAELGVGHGAGVSPFCAIHQPLRSAVARRITVGGKRLRLFELGCKSGSGHKGLAEEMIARTGVPRDRVEQALDNNMCCYAVTFED